MSHKQAISALPKDAAVPKAKCLHSSDLPYSKEILSMASIKGDPCPLFHIRTFHSQCRALSKPWTNKSQGYICIKAKMFPLLPAPALQGISE